jgi:hypothetical protein
MIINAEPYKPDLNLYDNQINTSDYSSTTDLFFCKPDFHFNSIADFQNKSKWIDAIIAGNIFPIHNILDVIDQSIAVSMKNGKHNKRVKNTIGYYRFAYQLIVDMEYYQLLKKYEGQNLKCFVADVNDNIFGVQQNGTIKGFDLDSIFLDKIYWQTASVPSWTMIICDYTNPIQMESAKVSKVDWEPGELYNSPGNFSLSQSSRITIFDFDFSNSDGIDWGNNGADNTIINNGSCHIGLTPPVSGGSTNWVRLSKVNESLGVGTYRMTINVISVFNGSIFAYLVSGAYFSLSLGQNSFDFTVTEENDILYIECSCPSAEIASFVFDDWKLQKSSSGDLNLILSAFSPDGRPITELEPEDIIITDSTQGVIDITSLINYEDGTYSLPGITLISGYVTIKSEHFNGVYNYNFS